MSSPIESLENTVKRLELRLAPKTGYHALEISEAQRELDNKIRARDEDESAFYEWSQIIDAVQQDERVLSTARQQFYEKCAMPGVRVRNGSSFYWVVDGDGRALFGPGYNRAEAHDFASTVKGSSVVFTRVNAEEDATYD